MIQKQIFFTVSQAGYVFFVCLFFSLTLSHNPKCRLRLQDISASFSFPLAEITLDTSHVPLTGSNRFPTAGGSMSF